MTKKQKTGPHQFMTIPNLLSLFRLITSPLVFWLFTLEGLSGRIATLVFLLVSFSTDFFDGWLARRLGQQSDAGRMLDPLADKAVVLCLLLAMVCFRNVSMYFVLAVLVREILILAGGLFIKVKKGIVVESNIVGKAATVVLMAAFLFFIFEELKDVAFIILFIGLGLASLSLAIYAVTFVRLMSQKNT